jgi:hypothetical protein
MVMSIKGSLDQGIAKKYLQIFLMEYLGWLEATLSNHHKEEDRERRNRFHTYLVAGNCLIVMEESRAYLTMES